MNSKELNRYFREIRLLLPLYSKTEKKFLRDFRHSVEEYVDDNPDCTIADIYEVFEKPEDVVYSYISTLDSEKLCKSIAIRKFIKIAVIVLLIIAVITSLFWCWTWYSAYLDSKNSIITETVIVIE